MPRYRVLFTFDAADPTSELSVRKGDLVHETSGDVALTPDGWRLMECRGRTG